MKSTKEYIKKLLPVKLKEILDFIYQQQAEGRRKAKIAERNRQKIEALLEGSAPILLELGAGENREISGWTYADLNENCDLCLDLTQPLPFPDNSIQMIYSSHLLEHFKYDELMAFLQECHRILKPGGIFNAAVPNARIYLDGYQDPATFASDIYCRFKPAFHNHSKIDYVNYIAYMDGQHHYLFDEENLTSIVKSVSFRKVRLREFDEKLDIRARDTQSIYVIGEKFNEQ